MRRVLRVVAPAAAAVALVVVGAVPAYAATKQITASGLPSCPQGQVATSVTLTLNNISAGQQITVQTAVSAITKSPDSISKGTATYSATLDAKYQSATATVDTWWNGTFQLTNATCQAARSAGVGVSSSLPGITPITLIAKITNPNDVMVTYQVSIPGHVVQRTSVLGHRTAEVDFQPAACGTSYTVSASGDDGTNSSGTGTTVDCQSTPTPPGTVPTQVTVSPTPSARTSSSASASSSPSASVSPSVTTSESDPFLTQDSNTGSPSVMPMAAPDAGKTHGASFGLTQFVMAGGFMLVLLGIAVVGFLVRSSRRAHADPDLED